jgi:hypothetical protein
MRARFHLTLPGHLADEPLLHRLGTEFGVVTNIKRASVEERFAWVILELDGEEPSVQRAVAWLAEQGVEVARIGEDG